LETVSRCNWVSNYNGGGVGWGEVLTVDLVWFLMVLKASKRLASMFFFGMSTTEFQEGATRNEGAIFAIKELENEPY
jgi:hypothetical protein